MHWSPRRETDSTTKRSSCKSQCQNGFFFSVLCSDSRMIKYSYLYLTVCEGDTNIFSLWTRTSIVHIQVEFLCEFCMRLWVSTLQSASAFSVLSDKMITINNHRHTSSFCLCSETKEKQKRIKHDSIKTGILPRSMYSLCQILTTHSIVSQA